jgi:hypothetical protein
MFGHALFANDGFETTYPSNDQGEGIILQFSQYFA